MRHRRAAVLTFWLLSLAAAPGCDEAPTQVEFDIFGSDADPELRLVPGEMRLVTGESAEFRAQYRESRSVAFWEVQPDSVRWMSQDPEVVIVEAPGRVAGGVPGRAGVQADYTKTAVANVRVEVGPDGWPGSMRLTSIAAGEVHTCGLDAAGDLYCWGGQPLSSDGYFASLRRTLAIPESDGRDPLAVFVPFTAPRPFALTRVAVGAEQSCALSSEGHPHCWGVNTPPEPETHRFVTLRAGGRHACALDGSGRAFCWGRNERGQLGDGGIHDPSTPLPREVLGGHRFRDLALSESYTCGATDGGALFCWGELPFDGSEEVRSEPVLVSEHHTYVQVAAADEFACAAGSDGAVHCWGYAAAGEWTTPVPLDGMPPVAAGSLTLGGGHGCGLTGEGAAYCWGSNEHGELGDAPVAGTEVPLEAATAFRFSSITAGSRHTCGITLDGDAYCWGGNDEGQLGVGHDREVEGFRRVLGQP